MAVTTEKFEKIAKLVGDPNTAELYSPAHV